ncbi:PhoH family protein [Paenibacillus sp. JSM ZJ436]|uniref:PhoH family protein n=1 Tax=Paenibacillus sp. JSM ZJ436 TaxID=3376190 RepID=UPI0037B27C81
MKRVLVDTNILLDGFKINSGYKYVVLSHVNRELDKHKVHGDGELKYKSRNAVRFIENNIDNFEFDIKDYNVTFDNSFDNNYTDNKIIQACLDNGYSLCTHDLLLKQKARMYGIELVEANEAENKETYTGVRELTFNDEQMSVIYEQPQLNLYDLKKNEYLLIKNRIGEYVDKFKWNGEQLVPVKWKKVSTRFFGDVKARNKRQELLFDLLQDKNITVKACFGRFGSGKDYCMITHAVSMLENGLTDKIVFCRNQIPLQNAPESGFRKGDNFDKMIEFAMPLADAVGGVEILRYMVEKGQVELQDLSRIRGRDIKNSILYVTEFQNNSSEHARLLLGRVGENSQLWLNGDIRQTDREIFIHNSGIETIKKLAGNELYGQVTLDKTERSKTASLAELI